MGHERGAATLSDRGPFCGRIGNPFTCLFKLRKFERICQYELGVNGLYRDGNVRAGTGIFNSDNAFEKATGDI